MRVFRILLKKELRGFYLNPFGWIILAAVVVMQGFSLSSVMKGFRDTPVKDSLVYVAFHTPVFWFYFIFIFPIITMRLFSEEEKTGTLETLLTAPVRTWQVVLSKFFAAYFFYVTLWIPSFVQFKMFSWVTKLPPELAWSTGSMMGAYAILMLMGAAFVALGCLASSLTSSQIISAIVTVLLLLMQYSIGFVTRIWGPDFPGAALFDYVSSQNHLHYFASGLLDTRPVVFYLTLTGFLLFLTFQVVDYRRWKN